MGALAEAFRYEQAKSKRPFRVKAMGCYTSRAYRWTQIDARVSQRLLRHLTDKPWVPFEPTVMPKVLTPGREARAAGATTAPTVRGKRPTG